MLKLTLKSTLITLLILANSWAQMMPEIILSGKNGGQLDGSPWSSKTLTGKVHAFFYVDPDEKDLNNKASEALAAQKFPLKKYGSLAVINMAATWLPNFAISSSLKKKQEQYPDTLYLKDLKKVFVKKWKLLDDSSNILIFDKDGKVVFRAMGKMNATQIDTMIKIVKYNL